MSKIVLTVLIFLSASVYDPQATIALLGPAGPYVAAMGDTLKSAVNVNTVMPGLRFGRG